jgi:uncharacterized protein YndB with AHSA1/START domain
VASVSSSLQRHRHHSAVQVDARFSRIETAVDIAVSPQRVFDHVTDPSKWLTWHPATVSVTETHDRPLTSGESVVETFTVMGLTRVAKWTVVACTRPTSWVIETESEYGAARITYTLTPTESGCRFHRAIDYHAKQLPWRLFNGNVTKLALSLQTKRALQNLKRVLETAK